jgi:hypothetical protein
MTKRPTLAEFSPEVLASNIQGQKLAAMKHAADADHRGSISAPIEDHTARVAKIANGEAVEPYVDRESRIRAAANRCHDMREAGDVHYKQSQKVKQKAIGELCKTLLPEHTEILKRAAAGLSTLHAALVDHNELKHYLIGEGGLVGICLTDFEKMFGSPTDRNSEIGMLFQEFVSTGILKSMPAGLK